MTTVTTTIIIIMMTMMTNTTKNHINKCPNKAKKWRILVGLAEISLYEHALLKLMSID